jgi:hypothetical protein
VKLPLMRMALVGLPKIVDLPFEAVTLPTIVRLVVVATATAWHDTEENAFPVNEQIPAQFNAGDEAAEPPKIDAAETLMLLAAELKTAPVVPTVSAPPVIVLAVRFKMPAAVTLMHLLAFALDPKLNTVVQLTVSVPVPE